ncbi:serine hydrolase domain-containing protein [Erwinia sp. V71]|uniref:serine hydrolase domain-containing protein n=1 Tax=Erwinia sp. V71 TaxID=3369424 RepID=UPI003F5F2E10
MLADCPAPLPQQVNALVSPLMHNQQTRGVAIGVLTSNGQRHIFSYGVTGDTQNTPVSGNTLFAVGSLTKSFTAETLALLAERGELGWNDTLQQRVGDKIWLSNDAQRITLLQLATHSAGLPPQGASNAPSDENIDSGDFLEYFGEFNTPPQPAVTESSLGYAMLNLIITLHSLRTVQDIASQQIIAPLKLQHTGYQPQTLPGYLQRAVGHHGNSPIAVQNRPFSGYMVATNGLWSSANDLLTYLTAHLYGSGDRALDRAFADATRVHPTAGDATALAWRSQRINGQTIVYQSDSSGGFSSYIGMNLQRKDAVVVMQNSSASQNNIGQSLLLSLAAEENCGTTGSKKQGR